MLCLSQHSGGELMRGTNMTNSIAAALAELSEEDVATLTATMEEFSWRVSGCKTTAFYTLPEFVTLVMGITLDTGDRLASVVADLHAACEATRKDEADFAHGLGLPVAGCACGQCAAIARGF